jgi:hypothetical protein
MSGALITDNDMKIIKIIWRCLFGLVLLLSLAALLVYFVPAIAMLLTFATIAAIKVAGWVGAGLCMMSLILHYCLAGLKDPIFSLQMPDPLWSITALLYFFGKSLCYHLSSLNLYITHSCVESTHRVNNNDRSKAWDWYNNNFPLKKSVNSIAWCLFVMAILIALAALLVSFVPAIAMLLPVATIAAIKVAGWVSAGLCITSFMAQCTGNSPRVLSAFGFLAVTLCFLGGNLGHYFCKLCSYLCCSSKTLGHHEGIERAADQSLKSDVRSSSQFGNIIPRNSSS